MRTPARVLHELAGSPKCPKPSEPATGLCWLCGLPCGGTGVLVRKAVGESFTDHANVALPEEDHVCVPCVWALSGRPPDTLRLYSVVWRSDRELGNGNDKAPLIPGACLTAKNDLSAVEDALLDPPAGNAPWFAALADTGQKHVVPFTRMSFGKRWCVRLEDEHVHGTPATFGRLLFLAASLYAAGYNRDEITSGNPRASKLIATGFDFWREHDQHVNPSRGSGLLRLAVFLLRKEGIENVRERARRFAPASFGGAPRPWGDAEREHGEDSSAGLVEQGAERAAERGVDGAELRPHDGGHGTQAADRRIQWDQRQCDLFDR